MCEPSLIMMGVGMALQYKAQQDAQARVRRALGLAEDRNDRYNQQVIDITDENAQQYDAKQRLEASDQAGEAATRSLTAYLQQARDAGMGEVSAATQGRTSQVFDAERARRTAAQADSAVRLAQLMGRVRGPMDLRTEEGFANADAASRLGLIGQEQLAMARAGLADARLAGTPDPFLTTVGGALRGYGAGMAASGGTTTTATGKPVAQSTYGPVYSGKRGPYIPRSLFKG